MEYQLISPDAQIASSAIIGAFVNLYGCEVGDETKVGTFVEIQRGAKVGARCKISSHSFICEGVIVEDEVFIGHGVIFVNDNKPQAVREDGSLETREDWDKRFVRTRVCRGASIGSGVVILGGVTIGAHSFVGAGAVVTKDVLPGTTVVGNPARVLS